jgi:hypothetical protein
MVPSNYREQLGLQPCIDDNTEDRQAEIKTRGPSAALRRHVRWIKELQQQVKDDQQQFDVDEKRKGLRKDSMQTVFKQQRDAIRKLRQDNGAVSREELESVMEAFPPTGGKAKAGKKPLWAMTTDEKEAVEEAEAEDLIRFAEGLDFDAFVGDLEFRHCLQAVKDRAKKLQKEQDAFKDSILREFNEADADGNGTETSSLAGDPFDGTGQADPSRRRRRPAGEEARPDWDNSTACGDEGKSAASDRSSKIAVERVLENNPNLRLVHSKESMQKLVEKARSDGVPATPHSLA